MYDDIYLKMASLVYLLICLLDFVISLSNASLEAKVCIGLLIILVGIVIALFISSGLGMDTAEAGINIIVGGILGYVTAAIVQVLFPLIPSPSNWIISLVPLAPLLKFVWRQLT